MASLSAPPCLLAALAVTGACSVEPAAGLGVGGIAAAGSPINAGATGATAGSPASIGGAAAGGAAGGAGAAGAGTPAVGGHGGGAGDSGMVGVFVAQGHEGRITRSCDDGLTFPYNHSADDAFRCFSDQQHDCDHSELAGRGLAFGMGSFVATWGWGYPGKLQRSIDGRQWADVMSEAPNFADVAYGNSLFVACGNPTRISTDGVTWQMGGKLSFDFNYRGIEFVPAGGGTFIVTGESGEQRAISYSHDGKTWFAASEASALCGQELRGIAGSDSVIIIASAQGHVCRSSDGDQWSLAQIAGRFTSPPVWTGTEFWIYSGSELHKSADGIEWRSQEITPNGISIGALARSPTGTLLAANDGWQVWYEKQRLYRSVDGVSWSVLEPGTFQGSHPINFVSFGYLPASAGCGLP